MISSISSISSCMSPEHGSSRSRTLGLRMSSAREQELAAVEGVEAAADDRVRRREAGQRPGRLHLVSIELRRPGDPGRLERLADRQVGRNDRRLERARKAAADARVNGQLRDVVARSARRARCRPCGIRRGRRRAWSCPPRSAPPPRGCAHPRRRARRRPRRRSRRTGPGSRCRQATRVLRPVLRSAS